MRQRVNGMTGSASLPTAVAASGTTRLDAPQWSIRRFKYLRVFYTDRLVRLAPALVIMVGTISFYAVTQKKTPLAEIRPDALAALFYVRNMLPRHTSDLGNDSDPLFVPIGQFLNTWSLAVEEQFYIFWSVAFAFIVPAHPRKRAAILTSMVFVSFSLRYTCAHHLAGISRNSGLTALFGIDYRYAWSSNVWKMLIGCAIRLCYVPRFALQTHTGVAATVALIGLSYFWGWQFKHWNLDFRSTGAWLELFTSCLVALVILGSLKGGNKILEWRLFRFPGRISYSWYLWQFPLHNLDGWNVGDWEPTCTAFVLATFVTFIVEEPLRNSYHGRKGKQATGR